MAQAEPEREHGRDAPSDRPCQPDAGGAEYGRGQDAGERHAQQQIRERGDHEALHDHHVHGSVAARGARPHPVRDRTRLHRHLAGMADRMEHRDRALAPVLPGPSQLGSGKKTRRSVLLRGLMQTRSGFRSG